MASSSTSVAPRPQLAYLTAVLDDLRVKGTYFRLRVLEDAQAPVCHYDGSEVINLASNNYLGLCDHPKLREAAIAATQKYGTGSGAVRTIAEGNIARVDVGEVNGRVFVNNSSLGIYPHIVHRRVVEQMFDLAGGEG